MLSFIYEVFLRYIDTLFLIGYMYIGNWDQISLQFYQFIKQSNNCIFKNWFKGFNKNYESYALNWKLLK